VVRIEFSALKLAGSEGLAHSHRHQRGLRSERSPNAERKLRTSGQSLQGPIDPPPIKSVRVVIVE
jgi:hypothetical protein